MSAKEFKVILTGAFGSGRTAFASSMVKAKKDVKKIPALKTEIYPLDLHTSAGEVKLKFYDSQLHAKGGLPPTEFFRQSDAALLFYDITSQASYDALETWYEALQEANNRKGSAPLPVIVVGTKVDKTTSRAVKPKDLEFMKTKGLPYLEISSKGEYKLKELITGLVRSLCGRGIQLTDEIEFEKASVEVDEAKAEEAMKEYTDASK
ncbi:hypothetical protein BLS_002686 [Venturia inaequalis]|uniref:Uncharacterized protein n=1 Tax=Venturia inaequalis TaxID=5025 RepID=A0A8H3UXY4_VENIN|nr:hypothetical protein BLS_002686 [Venturia inaequalis]KAE9977298.1 hypothetical protein EG328_002127 [Venturia inaequalis]